MGYYFQVTLPDKTVVKSGKGETNNIQSATLTRSVNSETELMPGSVCAAMFECKIQTPGGNLSVAAGDEITVAQISESGSKTTIGSFVCESPERSSANSYTITAYDRVSLLDKDLSVWLSELEEWPYTLSTFAKMVCTECGLTLSTTSFTNGSYEIQQFVGDGITGRQLMSWVAQIEGKFVRANSSGNIELAWYTSSGKTITAGGDLYYYGGSLKYEDYTCEKIQQVRIRLTEDDTGVVYPESEDEDLNILDITGNYLLTTTESETIEPIAQNLYNALKSFTYVPCSVKLPLNSSISAGSTVNITDANGNTITTCVMTQKVSGQSMTLESTGSARRDSSTAVCNVSIGALNAKMLEVKRDISGLNIRATSIETTVEENQKTTQEQIAEIDIRADGIESSVSSEIEGVKSELTEIKQSSEDVSIRIEKIETDGVDSVTTATGYTFDSEGMHIQKDGEEVSNNIDHTGMYVKRSDEVILQANADGVVAVDLHAKNYLIVGDYTRFENYNNGSDSKRTGLFWIGGEDE